MPSSRISLRDQIAAIRTVVENHDALAAEAGYTGEQGMPLNIGDEQSRSKQARSLLEECVNILKSGLGTEGFDVDETSLHTAAARAYGLRALRLVARNSQSLEETPTFNIRNLNASDLPIIVGSHSLCRKLNTTIATFQYKLDPTPQNAFAFTWALLVDGKVISRGTQQPLQKLVTGLMKPMQLSDGVAGDSGLNAKLRELADSAPTEKKWYFYLSNQNTTMHYLMFKHHRSVDSCMSKNYGFYQHIADDQNPMDCYDNSPDWNLMFWSEQSPEELLTMLALCEANMDEADRYYKYPFLTRNMCLPTSKCLDRNIIDDSFSDVHFVFGKIYGHDRLVNFFVHEGNEFMRHKASIAGGRIPVLMSRLSSYEDHRMLPYFDQANLARLIKDEQGNEWWEATYPEWHRTKRRVGLEDRTANPLVAKALYREGVAHFIKAYSPGSDQWIDISTCIPEPMRTMLGDEYSLRSGAYKNMTLSDGTVALVPSSWIVILNNGEEELMANATLLNNEWRRISDLERDPRYTNHPDFGWMLTRQAEMANAALGELRNND